MVGEIGVRERPDGGAGRDVTRTLLVMFSSEALSAAAGGGGGESVSHKEGCSSISHGPITR